MHFTSKRRGELSIFELPSSECAHRSRLINLQTLQHVIHTIHAEDVDVAFLIRVVLLVDVGLLRRGHRSVERVPHLLSRRTRVAAGESLTRLRV